VSATAEKDCRETQRDSGESVATMSVSLSPDVGSAFVRCQSSEEFCREIHSLHLGEKYSLLKLASLKALSTLPSQQLSLEDVTVVYQNC